MKMFRHWPKIPRLENEVYHITEKIDGTNACIIIQQEDILDFRAKATMLACINTNDGFYGIWAQSRTRLITPEDDNFGFAKWVQENAEQLIKDLGVGYHFGEWWGQGINRGYGLDHRRFSLFNPTKHSTCCYNVPLLVSEQHIDLLSFVETELIILETYGSYAAPGFMKPEGLVIYAEQAKSYWKVIIDK